MKTFDAKLLSYSNTYKVYVLLLEANRIYVGITKDVQKRYMEHCWGQAGTGAGFTKKYHPIDILEVFSTPYTDKLHAQEIENRKTIELMKQYGIDRVRGGEFCECDTEYLKRMMPKTLIDEITQGVIKGDKC